ncbi:MULTISPECIES: sigma-54-dependent transcriptional regulator [Sphingobacterium]|uniref:Sigma-54-dependent Fis family transcriptional regulator n=1 Tax=Sphingobacterium cellulitidis TaxID=1768011 RepID=A0A8H9FWK4_9SPHI|nr:MULTISPECIES: sigma-54 dependent transcriptional regulator [Sphingobacterium]MBA8985761.1 DNA-binding NtrC family response regulator [Sphingobacterium soli]OYD43771.1 sigma-54-dependent Fis family transcriptional regulator [Sphingobacterium cellulitidis]WFB64172.1 sigma-54 dependent transcriptional regulator [Sphingobacterium sp. WM]GGE07144.1 sigma-54-dependent Fis family transcriptional regulator [Sphingobacterium soli]
MKKATILVVDDDQDLLTATRILLRPNVKEVLVEHNPERLMNILEKNPVDIVMLDMNYKSAINTGNEGLFWLSKIKTHFPKVNVVMITAYGAVDLAVKSLKQGASDFIVKPWQNEQLLNTLNTIYEESRPSQKDKVVINPRDQHGIIGNSAIMEDLQYKLDKVSPTEANILILGENGTGKDLIANAIHQRSLRAKEAFVKVDVGSLTETLFESELFGYKKGAFTDAREDRKGRFEHADAGTLFLDEIGNISLQQQAKLLSVLQNRAVVPLGSSQPIPVDIRLISATNVPLKVLADENRFRKDLIYRINTLEIQVPPLRERVGDIPLLAEHFLKFYNGKYHKNVSGFESDALTKLKAYHFPGNVRELQYSIERAVIMSDQASIRAEDILFSPIEQQIEEKPILNDFSSHNLEEMERKAIKSAIDRFNGNISKAAKELGLTRAALYRRLEKYNL